MYGEQHSQNSKGTQFTWIGSLVCSRVLVLQGCASTCYKGICSHLPMQVDLSPGSSLKTLLSMMSTLGFEAVSSTCSANKTIEGENVSNVFVLDIPRSTLTSHCVSGCIASIILSCFCLQSLSFLFLSLNFSDPFWKALYASFCHVHICIHFATDLRWPTFQGAVCAGIFK